MFCICKNENNVKWIPFYTKKYDTCYMSFPHNLLKKNILLVDLSARRVSPCQCSVYNIILQSATLATLLNFKQNYFSELIWVANFRQVTFPENYGFLE